MNASNKCHCRIGKAATRGGFSEAGHRIMAGRRRSFPHILDFSRSDFDSVLFGEKNSDAQGRLSISGVQEKVLLTYYRGKLTCKDIKGHPPRYILKLIPSQNLENRTDVPANEHVSMHISSYLFGLSTAACCMVYFSDGEPALVVKRFDYDRHGGKIPQEDFCQITNRSAESHGRNFKYDLTCQDIMDTISRVSSAPKLDKLTFFHQLVVSYAIGNGDAHAKNFSMQTVDGSEVMLTPGYDILNTTLHIPNEDRTALELFAKDAPLTEGLKRNAFLTGSCFLKFAEENKLDMRQAENYVKQPKMLLPAVEEYVRQSFLSEEAMEKYLAIYRDRLKALNA